MAGYDRDEILRRLEASGLRGRGGSWFETHRKWRAVLAEGAVPLVVANGGESEPGSIKDRFILRRRPGQVIDGIRLALEALGADRGYVYLKGSFSEEERRVRAAIEEQGLSERVSIHRGDDTYVGGEETALLESIEGRKAWPRPKPPRPASVGLFGRPTLVQNVDTLSRIPEAVARGGACAADDCLTITIWGDVRTPGAYDVAAGRTIRSVVETEAGGPSSDIGLVFPNGAQARPLQGDEIDWPLDPAFFTARGVPLGTASILVLDRAASAYSLVESIARFFERDACGQCPPCVLGTTNLRSLVTGDRPATIRLTPQRAIRETASFMEIHGYCGHSRSAAASITTLFERFEREIVDRLRTGTRPEGQVDRDPFSRGSAERAALERSLEGI